MKYVLYGLYSGSISEASVMIRRALGVALELRDSSYKGGEYYRFKSESGWDLTVESNWRDEDGVLAKPEFSEFPVLVYVNEIIPEVEVKLNGLSGLQELQSKIL